MTENTENTPNTFSWKKPEKYWPKQNYYKDLIMSYSAMTDIINPDAIECDYTDVRVLDGMMIDQAAVLHELTKTLLNRVKLQSGNISESNLMMGLKTQKAFRDTFQNANLTLTRRYMASHSAL